MNIITIKQITHKFKISRTTFWRYRQYDGFPKKLQESGKGLRWNLDEIEYWFNNWLE